MWRGILSAFFLISIVCCADDPQILNQDPQKAKQEISALNHANDQVFGLKLTENDKPIADSQEISTKEGESVDIVLTGSDPNGGELSFAIEKAPLYGQLSGEPPYLTYTPNAGFIGEDHFSFKADNGLEDSIFSSVQTQQPIKANSKILILGTSASIHAATLNRVIEADDSVNLMNLTIDAFDSQNIHVDFFKNRQVQTDKNTLLRALDRGYDMIVIIPEEHIETFPEFCLESIRLIKDYTASLHTQLVLAMTWAGQAAIVKTPVYEEHAYRIADALDLAAVPAGLAWKKVLGDQLLNIDNSSLLREPSSAAKYTFASSVYVHLFHKKPDHSTYLEDGLNADTQNQINQHVFRVWEEALVDSHYSGSYKKSSFAPLDVIPDFDNRKWVALGTSTEGGVYGKLRQLIKDAGYANKSRRLVGYHYDGDYNDPYQRYFPGILNHPDVQNFVATEDYTYFFSRWMGGSYYSHMKKLDAYDPGADSIGIVFGKHYSRNVLATIRFSAIPANSHAIAARQHARVHAIPNKLAIARVWQERPDLILVPSDNIHLTYYGSMLHAGLMYTLLTRSNPALIANTIDPDEIYLLNLAYDVAMGLGQLKKTEATPISIKVQPLDNNEPSIIGETGTLSIRQKNPDEWFRVDLQNSYASPVVILGPASNHGLDPVSPRVRGVTADGFEIQIDEWEYLNGIHTEVSISYLVIEEGEHLLSDDRRIQAGFAEANTDFSKIHFSTPFDNIPAVFSQVVSANDPRAVTTRLTGLNMDRFKIKLKAEEAVLNHGPEAVAWVAIEMGTSDLLEVASTDRTVNQKWRQVYLEQFLSSNSAFFASLQSHFGSDTATLRYRNVDESFEVRVQEEQSYDDEVKHTNEVVGYMALPIDAFIWGH